jgi:hypothetical protein
MDYQNERSTKASAAVTGNTITSTSSGNNRNNDNEKRGVHHKAVLYMILLAIQFGIQPIITRRYTSSTINKSTVLFVQEVIKFLMAYGMLLLSGETSTALQGTKYLFFSHMQ